jgi:hypothetical protein
MLHGLSPSGQAESRVPASTIEQFSAKLIIGGTPCQQQDLCRLGAILVAAIHNTPHRPISTLRMLLACLDSKGQRAEKRWVWREGNG